MIIVDTIRDTQSAAPKCSGCGKPMVRQPAGSWLCPSRPACKDSSGRPIEKLPLPWGTSKP